jgi:hypothetical protein
MLRIAWASRPSADLRNLDLHRRAGRRDVTPGSCLFFLYALENRVCDRRNANKC